MEQAWGYDELSAVSVIGFSDLGFDTAGIKSFGVKRGREALGVPGGEPAHGAGGGDALGLDALKLEDTAQGLTRACLDPWSRW